MVHVKSQYYIFTVMIPPAALTGHVTPPCRRCTPLLSGFPVGLTRSSNHDDQPHMFKVRVAEVKPENLLRGFQLFSALLFPEG